MGNEKPEIVYEQGPLTLVKDRIGSSEFRVYAEVRDCNPSELIDTIGDMFNQLREIDSKGYLNHLEIGRYPILGKI